MWYFGKKKVTIYSFYTLKINTVTNLTKRFIIFKFDEMDRKKGHMLTKQSITSVQQLLKQTQVVSLQDMSGNLHVCWNFGKKVLRECMDGVVFYSFVYCRPFPEWCRNNRPMIIGKKGSRSLFFKTMGKCQMLSIFVKSYRGKFAVRDCLFFGDLR